MPVGVGKCLYLYNNSKFPTFNKITVEPERDGENGGWQTLED